MNCLFRKPRLKLPVRGKSSYGPIFFVTPSTLGLYLFEIELNLVCPFSGGDGRASRVEEEKRKQRLTTSVALLNIAFFNLVKRPTDMTAPDVDRFIHVILILLLIKLFGAGPSSVE
jgi:hypothetical protein